MIDLSQVSAHPLTWPVGWPRTKQRQQSRFRGVTMATATREVFDELGRMGVGDYNVIISTNVAVRRDGLPYSNQRRPDDPGVAVYFRLKNKPHVLACDRWHLPEENLWAIAKHIDALRGQARWGVGTLEQAFTGYAALPAPPDDAQWWRVLGLEETASNEAIKSRYRELVLRHRPDLHEGPPDPVWTGIQAAYEKARIVRGYA